MLYTDIKMRWNAFTFPIAAGTPVAITGTPANDATAVGIIPDAITIQPIGETARVITGGDVDLDAMEASYGQSYSEDALQAMDGISFMRGGTRVPNVYSSVEPSISNVITTVWTNPSPSADFAGQTVSLGSGTYSFYMVLIRTPLIGDVVYMVPASNGGVKVDVATLEGTLFVRTLKTGAASSGNHTMEFTDATDAEGVETVNSWLKPVLIYGIK